MHTYQGSPLERSNMHTSVHIYVCMYVCIHEYIGLHAYTSTHTFTLLAPISASQLGLREALISLLWPKYHTHTPIKINSNLSSEYDMKTVHKGLFFPPRHIRYLLF